MNYELVKTEVIDGIEYGYLFDIHKGVIYRVQIQGVRVQSHEVNLPPVVPYVPPPATQAISHAKPLVPTINGIPLDDLEIPEPPAPRPPVLDANGEMPRARSMIPPDFQRLAIEGGMPGEDLTVKRTT